MTSALDGFPPLPVCQNDGGFNLAFRDVPVSFEKPVLLLIADSCGNRAFHKSGSPKPHQPRFQSAPDRCVSSRKWANNCDPTPFFWALCERTRVESG